MKDRPMQIRGTLLSVLCATLLLGGYAIWRGMILEPPAFLLKIGDAWGQWLQRRAGLPARSSP